MVVEIANGTGEGFQKLLGHLSNVEEIISIEKICLCHILFEVLISNDLSQVFVYDLGEFID